MFGEVLLSAKVLEKKKCKMAIEGGKLTKDNWKNSKNSSVTDKVLYEVNSKVVDEAWINAQAEIDFDSKIDNIAYDSVK